MAKDTEIFGLFIPAEEKLFIILETQWTNNKTSLDSLRKILLARGLVDFGIVNLSTARDNTTQVQKLMPKIMSVAEAKRKGYPIEQVAASALEAKRQAAAVPEEPKGNGMFGKK
jgi:hypothetical protein